MPGARGPGTWPSGVRRRISLRSRSSRIARTYFRLVPVASRRAAGLKGAARACSRATAARRWYAGVDQARSGARRTIRPAAWSALHAVGRTAGRLRGLAERWRRRSVQRALQAIHCRDQLVRLLAADRRIAQDVIAAQEPPVGDEVAHDTRDRHGGEVEVAALDRREGAEAPQDRGPSARKWQPGAHGRLAVMGRDGIQRRLVQRGSDVAGEGERAARPSSMIARGGAASLVAALKHACPVEVDQRVVHRVPAAIDRRAQRRDALRSQPPPRGAPRRMQVEDRERPRRHRRWPVRAGRPAPPRTWPLRGRDSGGARWCRRGSGERSHPPGPFRCAVAQRHPPGEADPPALADRPMRSRRASPRAAHPRAAGPSPQPADRT